MDVVYYAKPIVLLDKSDCNQGSKQPTEEILAV